MRIKALDLVCCVESWASPAHEFRGVKHELDVVASTSDAHVQNVQHLLQVFTCRTQPPLPRRLAECLAGRALEKPHRLGKDRRRNLEDPAALAKVDNERLRPKIRIVRST